MICSPKKSNTKGDNYGRHISKIDSSCHSGIIGDRKDISRCEAVADCGRLLWALYNDSFGGQYHHCQNQLSFTDGQSTGLLRRYIITM